MKNQTENQKEERCAYVFVYDGFAQFEVVLANYFLST